MIGLPDLNLALRELPIFPLRGAVLFPGTVLPLHVFEERYRALARDALATHRTLAIAHVPDPLADLAGNPPIAELAGVGSIVDHRELSDGRFHLVLLGRARVRLDELSFRAPYRRAVATVLEATPQPVAAVHVAALHGAITAFAALVRARDKTFALHLPEDASPSALADACAQQLIIDPLERQRVLEAVDARTRVRIVTEVLTVQRATLQPGPHTLN
jgi:Lon protease-like protein